MDRRRDDTEFLFEVDDDDDEIGVFHDDIDLDEDDMIDFDLVQEHRSSLKRGWEEGEDVIMDDDNQEMTMESHLAML